MGPQVARTILRKIKKARGSHFLFQTILQAIVIKTIWYWHKSKYKLMEQKRDLKN